MVDTGSSTPLTGLDAKGKLSDIQTEGQQFDKKLDGESIGESPSKKDTGSIKETDQKDNVPTVAVPDATDKKAVLEETTGNLTLKDDNVVPPEVTDDSTITDQKEPTDDLEQSKQPEKTPEEDPNKAEDLTLVQSEDIPSFDEWKQKMLLEQQSQGKIKMPDSHHSTSNGHGSDGANKKTNQKKVNYASLSCGSKLTASNSEAQNPKYILSDDKDKYMIQPCNAKKWFVVELCEPVKVEKIKFGNQELFSSLPESFVVSVSDRYPTKEWNVLGTFKARDERTIQSFYIGNDMYAKFLKVDMLSHYGKEHYCPLSSLMVFGQDLHEDDGDDESHNIASDDDVEDSQPAEELKKSEQSNNLFDSAKNTVISIVKTVLNGNKDSAGNKGENGQDISLDTVTKDSINKSSNASSSEQSNSSSRVPEPCLPDVNSGVPENNIQQVQEELKEDGSNQGDSVVSNQPETPNAETTPDSHTHDHSGPLVRLIQSPDQTTSPKSFMLSVCPYCFNYTVGNFCIYHDICSYYRVMNRNLNPTSCAWFEYCSLSEKQENNNDELLLEETVENEVKTSDELINEQGQNSNGDSDTENDKAVDQSEGKPAVTENGIVPDGVISSETKDKVTANGIVNKSDSTGSLELEKDSGSENNGQAVNGRSSPKADVNSPVDKKDDVSTGTPGSGSSMHGPDTVPMVVPVIDNNKSNNDDDIKKTPDSEAKSVSSDSSPSSDHSSKTDVKSNAESSESHSKSESGTSHDNNMDKVKKQKDETKSEPSENSGRDNGQTSTLVDENRTTGSNTDTQNSNGNKKLTSPDTDIKLTNVDSPSSSKTSALPTRSKEEPSPLLTGSNSDKIIYANEMNEPGEENSDDKSSSSDDSDQGGTVQYQKYRSLQKETTYMKLKNKIRELEINLTLSSRYLEELSKKYKQRMEDMYVSLNRTIQKLTNTSKTAEIRDLRQQERISVLEMRVEHLSNLSSFMSDRVDAVHSQVIERHMWILLIEIIVFLSIMAWCVNREKRHYRDKMRNVNHSYFNMTTKDRPPATPLRGNDTPRKGHRRGLSHDLNCSATPSKSHSVASVDSRNNVVEDIGSQSQTVVPSLKKSGSENDITIVEPSSSFLVCKSLVKVDGGQKPHKKKKKKSASSVNTLKSVETMNSNSSTRRKLVDCQPVMSKSAGIIF